MLDFILIQVPNKLVQNLMYPYSLGLLYLSAMLEKAGASVKLIDLRDKTSLDIGDIPEAKFIGFTATTGEINDAKRLSRLLKAKYPQSTTIIGGAHASALPEDCVDYFDIVACVPADTIIAGDNLEIEKINEGDIILSSTGGRERVLKKFTRQFSGELITIKPKGLPSIEITSEHKVLTNKIRFKSLHRGQIRIIEAPIWKKAGELQVDDWLIIPRTKIEREENFSLRQGRKGLGASLSRGKSGIDNSSWQDRRIWQNYEVNKEIAFILGLWCAEGSVTKYRAYFHLGSHETELISKLRTLLKENLGLDTYLDQKNSSANVLVNNKDFAEFLAMHIGRGARNKRIPTFIKEGTKEIARSFFLGLWNGDGDLNNGKRGCRMRLGTASKRLFYDTMELLFKIGVSFGSSIDKSGEYKINNRKGLRGTCYNLFLSQAVFENKNRSDGHKIGCQMVILDNYVYIKIQYIKRKQVSDVLVYNLGTEDSTYNIPFIVHNCGEWEYAIVNLLEHGHSNGIINGGTIPDLNKLPFPARHLIPERSFSDTLMPGEYWGEGEKAAMVMTSRGCPMKCAFCSNNFKPPVRFRSPENIIAELQELKDRYDCHAFRDEQDNIALNKKWLLRYCEYLAPLNMRWKGHSRAQHLQDEDKIIALKASGMVECGIGVESVDPAVLKAVNKKETPEDYRKAIALLKKHGIIAKAYFIIGLPQETDKTLELNAKFVEETQPDKVTCSLFQPYPGSDIFNRPEVYGATIHRDSYNGYWLFMGTTNVEYEGVSREQISKRYEWMFEFLNSGKWRK